MLCRGGVEWESAPVQLCTISIVHLHRPLRESFDRARTDIQEGEFPCSIQDDGRMSALRRRRVVRPPIEHVKYRESRVCWLGVVCDTVTVTMKVQVVVPQSLAWFFLQLQWHASLQSSPLEWSGRGGRGGGGLSI